MTSSIRVVPFYLLSILLLEGCKTKVENDQVSVQTEGNAQIVAADVPFPVYDYEGFAPLLNKDTDSIYIYNFWATWCKPCIEEMPFFERILDKQNEAPIGLTYVSLDMPTMWQKQLVPFVQQKNLKGKVVILDDPNMNNWIPRVNEKWGGGIPATLIYKQQHRVFREGGYTYEELSQIIDSIQNL